MMVNRYVYHVYAGDYEGFVEALRQASTTPTPRYINELMTVESVRERMKSLMETDWKQEAEIFRTEQAHRGIEYVSHVPSQTMCHEF